MGFWIGMALAGGPTEAARPLTDAERTAMVGVVWREGCPVPLDALVHLSVPHVRPDGSEATGELIVHRDVAALVATAFHKLHELGFPIEKMVPVEAYGGDDTRSMEANNTSAFNCRAKTGGAGWSRHSYGTAIDVNPLWNPWVKADPARPDGLRVEPEAGRPWADRSRADPGMLLPGSDAVRAFTDLGWRWGGAWTSLKDYQHLSSDGT